MRPVMDQPYCLVQKAFYDNFLLEVTDIRTEGGTERAASCTLRLSLFQVIFSLSFHLHLPGNPVGQINQTPDESTGPFARPFTHLLAPLTCLLAPPCLLCSLHTRSATLAHSLVHSLILLLAHFTHSLPHGKVFD